jgi:hypothetical protein
MRDSTYVMIGLALCSLVMLALSMQKPAAMYMLDLEDFKALPVELRSALRRMLPDPVTIRQRWAHMTPDQKRNAIQQLGGFIPQPSRPRVIAQQHPNDVEPVHVAAPEPEPAPVEPEPMPVIVEEPVEPAPPLKKGFLDTVKKGKKKDTKNKKENEVVALGAVGADVSLNGSDPSGGFLGRDD